MQTLNPDDILFSVPTLSNDLPNLLGIDQAPDEHDFFLNEDDWSQLEFFSGDRLEEMQRMLGELKEFEAAHRCEAGWRKVYVRNIARLPMANGSLTVDDITKQLNAKPGRAPMLYQAPNTLTGQVEHGFSMQIGGNISLYGYTEGEDISILATSLGAQADNARLAHAFMQLHASLGLIMVDWRSQFLLQGVNAEGQINIWRP